MDKNLSTLIKIRISEQTTLAAVFYSFCRLINKNVLQWFLLRPDLQIPLVETIPHCFFDLGQKVGRCPISNCYFIKPTRAATRGVPYKRSCS